MKEPEITGGLIYAEDIPEQTFTDKVPDFLPKQLYTDEINILQYAKHNAVL
jgi:hypothetical protein